MEKRAEKVEYNIWEMREIAKVDKTEIEKLALRLASLNQQFIGDLKSLENRVDTINSGQSP